VRFDTNPIPTQAVVDDTGRIDQPTPMVKMYVFAAFSGRIRTDADSSGRICTAEGVGSNPIGSTAKYACLQVKRERSVEDPDLVYGFVLQPNCNMTSEVHSTPSCTVGSPAYATF
jgi:hypothetical protein